MNAATMHGFYVGMTGDLSKEAVDVVGLAARALSSKPGAAAASLATRGAQGVTESLMRNPAITGAAYGGSIPLSMAGYATNVVSGLASPLARSAVQAGAKAAPRVAKESLSGAMRGLRETLPMNAISPAALRSGSQSFGERGLRLINPATGRVELPAGLVR